MDRYSYIWLGFVLWLTAVLIAVLINLAIAGTVRLAWDHDGAEGYRLYMAKVGYPMVQVWQGATKTTSVSAQDGKTYQFYVTAFSGAQESGPSNTLVYTVPRKRR